LNFVVTTAPRNDYIENDYLATAILLRRKPQ